MVTLEPMQQEDFDRFAEKEVKDYAAQHVRNGNWPEEGSLERARKELETLLPDGIHTPHQYIWSLVVENQNIGFLWIQDKDHKAFIWDFLIHEEFRGNGYGRQALAAMDERLKSMNVESVALHVFGDNITAQELFRKMGFEVTGIHMRMMYR